MTDEVRALLLGEVSFFEKRPLQAGRSIIRDPIDIDEIPTCDDDPSAGNLASSEDPK